MVEEFDSGNLVINQPAGHVESGEGLISADVRETEEETGWRLMLYITFNSAMLKSKSLIRSSPAWLIS